MIYTKTTIINYYKLVNELQDRTTVQFNGWRDLHDTPRNIAESNGDKIIFLYFQSEAGLTYSFRDCTDGENIIPPEKFVDELLNKYPLFRRI